MRTWILPLASATALMLPSCTLVFNEERHWNASVDAPGLDAAMADTSPDVFTPFDVPDAFIPVDAPRMRPTSPGPTDRVVSLTCPAYGTVIAQDPVDGSPSAPDASLLTFPGWHSFAMLGNNVDVTVGSTHPSPLISSHAIWMDAGQDPHAIWLVRSSADGMEHSIDWDVGLSPVGTYSATTPFIRATAERFIVGGGNTLVECFNLAGVVVGGPNCADAFAPVGGGPVWGGFGPAGFRPGVATIVAQQIGNDVSFPDSIGGAEFPSTDTLRQPTGTGSSALYSDSTLFIVGTESPAYSVTPVTLPDATNARVSYDGTGYIHASITTGLSVAVSTCDADPCVAGSAAISIDLAGETLVDWNFHAIGDVRIAVLLTSAAKSGTPGTHVSVAMWHARDVGPVTPLRIASGRGLMGVHGDGRSIESVARLVGGQLDVYVSALVSLSPSAQDHIYLSGFRLCL